MIQAVPRTVISLIGLLVVLTGVSLHAERPLTMVVMDPLALPLSCACVDGVGQRRYESLATNLSQELNREVELVYEESLQLALRRAKTGIDMVVGKRSTVLHDASATDLKFQSVAALSDRRGLLTTRGALLVRKDSSIHSESDLAGKTLAVGPPEHAECHDSVKALFQDDTQRPTIIDHDSIESAVYAFADNEADAVAVSDFLPPLLAGCGKLQKDSFRIVARTETTPFIEAFVSTEFDAPARHKIATAIIRSTQSDAVRELVESKSGFVSLGWNDWRGPHRRGRHDRLPKELPDVPHILWRSQVTGPAMAGISASESIVMVADKSSDFAEDIFRAFDSVTGQPLWTIRYPATGKMDYTSAPRATPVIVGDRVILQGAFGDLVCADITNGRTVWRKHLINDFGGELPSWGYCVPPLVVRSKVIVAPGGKEHAILGLNLDNGAIIWSTKGHAAAYAPMIHATYGGREQVIGYDSASLVGWDVESGDRIWELIPPDNTDFHVGTPVSMKNSIMVATENNATRVYGFDDAGTLITEPIKVNDECAPDTCTPVISRQRAFCSAYGELFCLDTANMLQTIWSQSDDRFYDHTCLIGGNDRLLLWSSSCDLLLIDAIADEFTIISSIRPMSNPKAESMSHPAMVGDNLYLRSQNELICLRLSQSE